MTADGTFRFGEFELDPRRMELREGGAPVSLHNRPLGLLVYLVAHRGRTVSKDEILERVWPGAAVTESSITTALSEVRHALKDDGASQRWIKTIKGEGFRFVGDIQPNDEVPTTTTPAVRRGPLLVLVAAGLGLALVLALAIGRTPEDLPGTPPLTSVAVLPFNDLSEGGEHAHVARGMSEELTRALASVPSLRVASTLR